jgi:hypothetical protein
MQPIRRIRAEDLTKVDTFSETMLVICLVATLGIVLALLRVLS